MERLYNKNTCNSKVNKNNKGDRLTTPALYQIEKDAFLAGLFDADGCVSIYNSLKKKSNKNLTVKPVYLNSEDYRVALDYLKTQNFITHTSNLFMY